MPERDDPKVEVDLENCAKEPIHIIGKTQEHGVLLVCNPENLEILQASDNTRPYFNRSWDELIGKALDRLLPVEVAERLCLQLRQEDLSVPVEARLNEHNLLIVAHRSGKDLLLDFEPLNSGGDAFFYQKQLTRILNRFSEAASIKTLCQQASQLCKDLYGYDRVMVYRFDEDWNGEVIAESREPDMESWLDLHYPATDIPAQSRAMFLHQRIRVITDVHYKPVPLRPECSPLDGHAVDLTPSSLRAVSPIHIEYLQNMGVGASMTASLVVQGKLWGLMACHHRQPKFLDHFQRESCRFLAETLSTEITLRETRSILGRTRSSEELRRAIHRQLLEQDDLVSALCDGKVKITDLLQCGGAAVHFQDAICCCGETPEPQEVRDLVQYFLRERSEGIVAVKNLPEHFAPAKAYKEVASGLLGMRVAENKYILWFRPEQIRNVTWGGNPDRKAFYNNEKNRISPRKSFEKWTQRLTGTAQGWEDIDISVARALRESISHIILTRQRREIEGLNTQLRQANEELELFSYGLSHDLRAPVRGILGLLEIIKEDYGGSMDQEGLSLLEKMKNLGGRMNSLIDDILDYARLSRPADLQVTEIETAALVREVIDFLQIDQLYPRVRVLIQPDLPGCRGDRRMLFQLWANLIGNACKYSAAGPEPRVEVGFEADLHSEIFYVRDNGIGIPQEFLEKIFATFTRVAGGKFEGSGIGLAMAKKIVEKHQGKLWAESSPGAGAAFYFQLGLENQKR